MVLTLMLLYERSGSAQKDPYGLIRDPHGLLQRHQKVESNTFKEPTGLA